MDHTFSCIIIKINIPASNKNTEQRSKQQV